MAQDFRINKVNYHLPVLPFVVNDVGDVVGFQSQTGQITLWPLSVYAGGLTATSGGGQAGALKLNYRNARVTTVAAAGDSVALPPAISAGLSITVINAGANPMQVFGDSAAGDTINGVATATGVSQAAGLAVVYESHSVGAWVAVSAVGASLGAGASGINATYTANASAVGFTATAAEISGNAGYAGFVELDLTGNPAAGAALTLPTVAALLAAISNPQVGHSYVLRVKNSANTGTWTITTNTGWTLAGTMTVATGTWRDVLVKITSVSGATATLQNLGGGATL